MASALIVTLCKSLNYGAYLQALALQEVLRNKGMTVEFMDVYDLRQETKRYRSLFRKQDRSWRGVLFNLRKLREFVRAESVLNIGKRHSSLVFDAAFLGSDEIWCVNNGTFFSAREFFGVDVQAKHIFSYAPSGGNSTPADAKKEWFVKAGLPRIELVSVRDQAAEDIVKCIRHDVSAVRVLDPTFLFDFSPYEVACSLTNYLVIYSYGMDATQQSEITAFAKANGLKTVSPGFYNNWCDVVIPCSPFEFLGIIKGADYIVTDTFHGSVFSIKYKKSFAVYVGGKSKVTSLLDELSIGQVKVNHAGMLASVLSGSISYAHCEEELQRRLDESHSFLDACVARASG